MATFNKSYSQNKQDQIRISKISKWEDKDKEGFTVHAEIQNCEQIVKNVNTKLSGEATGVQEDYKILQVIWTDRLNEVDSAINDKIKKSPGETIFPVDKIIKPERIRFPAARNESTCETRCPFACKATPCEMSSPHAGNGNFCETLCPLACKDLPCGTSPDASKRSTHQKRIEGIFSPDPWVEARPFRTIRNNDNQIFDGLMNAATAMHFAAFHEPVSESTLKDLQNNNGTREFIHRVEDAKIPKKRTSEPPNSTESELAHFGATRRGAVPKKLSSDGCSVVQHEDLNNTKTNTRAKIPLKERLKDLGRPNVLSRTIEHPNNTESESGKESKNEVIPNKLCNDSSNMKLECTSTAKNDTTSCENETQNAKKSRDEKKNSTEKEETIASVVARGTSPEKTIITPKSECCQASETLTNSIATGITQVDLTPLVLNELIQLIQGLIEKELKKIQVGAVAKTRDEDSNTTSGSVHDEHRENKTNGTDNKIPQKDKAQNVEKQVAKEQHPKESKEKIIAATRRRAVADIPLRTSSDAEQRDQQFQNETLELVFNADTNLKEKGDSNEQQIIRKKITMFNEETPSEKSNRTVSDKSRNDSGISTNSIASFVRNLKETQNTKYDNNNADRWIKNNAKEAGAKAVQSGTASEESTSIYYDAMDSHPTTSSARGMIDKKNKTQNLDKDVGKGNLAKKETMAKATSSNEITRKNASESPTALYKDVQQDGLGITNNSTPHENHKTDETQNDKIEGEESNNLILSPAPTYPTRWATMNNPTANNNDRSQEDLHNQSPKSRIRLCHMKKYNKMEEYGFTIHSDKNRVGQFIGKVDKGSAAEAAGLMEGYRIIEVNGIDITRENHNNVVNMIKAKPGEAVLLIVDEESLHNKSESLPISTSMPGRIVEKTLEGLSVADGKYNNGKDNTATKRSAVYEEPTESNQDGRQVDQRENKTPAAIEKPDLKEKINITSAASVPAGLARSVNRTEKHKDPEQIKTIEKARLAAKDSIENKNNKKLTENAGAGTDISNHLKFDADTPYKEVEQPFENSKEELISRNLEMTAKEYRMSLKKKYDPRNDPIDIKRKCTIFEQL